MSKKIDERVVEMQFDNKQFERNVSTTMSTLDKLKEKLKFKDASSGLESVSKAAKNVDMSGLNNGVETLRMRFSSLEVVAVTALANITNSAINAGKRMVSALTLDPVISGFQEYETQINAVQTILANTQSKGSTLEDVNAALDELNKYADQTIYNFTEMTRNIGTFTAAGVELDTAVTSIKGIANLAAVSGSNAQQASTAMYQLSQAIAAGKVQLTDWNSVVNAGMGGELFQNALKRTAKQMGTDVDALIEKYGSFRETLTKTGWLTTEVLTETLTQLSGAYTEADLIAQGYSESQAKEIVQLAETAVGAATDVKTFTQLIDTLKEAIQSGWTQTWEIIIGDFEEAKTLWTEVSNTFGDIVSKISNSRNNLLEGAFSRAGEDVDALIQKLGAVGITTDDFTSKLKEVAQQSGITSDEFDNIVKTSGSLSKAFQDGSFDSNLLSSSLKEFGIQGATSYDILMKKINDCGIETEDFEAKIRKLAEASGITSSEFDQILAETGSLEAAFRRGKLPIDLVSKALTSFGVKLDNITAPINSTVESLETFQNLVNKTIRGDFGNGTARIEALTKAGYDNVAVQKLVNKVWERNGYTWSDTTISADDLADVISDLSTEEIKSIGYTEDQAKTLKGLADQAEKTGVPLSELINDLNKPTGRELLIDSFRNALTGLKSVCEAVGNAWRNAFPPMTSDELYNVIDGIHTFSAYLVPAEDTIDKLTRTFKGLFAILDIITTITGGAFKVAFKVLTTVLGMADLDILSVTAHLGDMIVGFRDFMFSNEFVTTSIETLSSGIIWLVTAVKDLVDAFLALPQVQDAIEKFIDKLKELKEVGANAIEGLQNGLQDGTISIPQILIQIGKAILDAIKNVLGIHSPSTEMHEVGENTVQGFVNGVKDGASGAVTAIKEFGEKCLEAFKKIPWDTVIAAGVSVALLLIVKNIVGAVEAIAAPLEGVGDVLSGVGEILSRSAKPIAKTIKSFSKVLNAKAFGMRADGIKSIAIGLALLAASIYLIAQLDTGKLWNAIAAMAALAAIIGLLSFSVSTFGPKEALSFSGFALGIVGITAGLLIMAGALKVLDTLDPSRLSTTLDAFVTIILSLTLIVTAYGQLVDGEASKNVNKLGTMMLKLSVSLLLMAVVIKLMSGMSPADIDKGILAITAFVGLITLLSLVSKLTGKNADLLGSMMIKMSVAMILLIAVVKLVSGLKATEIAKGGLAILAFAGVITLLTMISKIGGTEMGKLGRVLLAMSASMLLMVVVVKMVSGLSISDMVKGTYALLAFTGIISLLVLITKLAGKDLPKLSLTLLSMSVSIGILAGVAILLSLIDIGGLAKGIVAIGMLSAFMAGMIYITKFAQDVKGSLIVLTVAIGVLAAAVVALSFIDPKKLAGATLALSIVMGMFALIVKSTAAVNASIGPLIVMVTAIGILTAALMLLSTLPIEASLSTAASLSMLLISLAAVMKVTASIGKASLDALASLVVMTLIVAALASIISFLAPLDITSTLGIASSLSMLLLSLSAACVILAAVGKVGTGAALNGALALDGVILIVGGLMAAIGALTEYFPQMESFLDTGIGMLEKIGYGIGSFVGNIVGGLLGGLTSGLPLVGENLSLFMTNLSSFIEGAKSIDEKALAGVIMLGAMITAIAAAEIIDSIASFIPGGSSLNSFADQLVPFGEAMVEFSNTISGNLDTDAVTAAANAGLTLSQLASNLPKEGGLLQAFLGSSDFVAFGDQLTAFGEAIVDFSDTVSGNVDSASVEAAANAGMALANLAKNLPREGGFLQEFLGEQDLETFGVQLTAFGEAMVGFSQTVSGNVDAASVEAAANAGLAMASLANNLPKQGGFLQDFLGEQDLETFGTQLTEFGTAIVTFSNTVSGNIDYEAVEAAKNAGLAINELATALPEQDGWAQVIFGEQNMADFGNQLVSFGRSFASYSAFMSQVNTDVLSTTTSAADSLVKLADSLPENGLISTDTRLSDFGDQLKKFGEKFYEYYTSISEVDTTALNYSILSFSSLLNLIKGMQGVDFTAADGFSSSLNTLAKTNIDAFIATFDNSHENVATAVRSLISSMGDTIRSDEDLVVDSFSSVMTAVASDIVTRYAQFNSLGKTLVNKLGWGATENESVVTNSFTSILGGAVSSVRGYYQNFYDAGKYLVQGFAAGISDNISVAAQQAAAMAISAYNAAMSAINAHSPSRLFMKVGSYVALGFANGILGGEDEVSSSATAMANTALNSTKKAIAMIADAVDDQVDIQPTIRPVLDLTDVETKAGHLNAMFSSNRAMAIGARMNEMTSGLEIQNGDTSAKMAPVFKFEQNNYSPKALSNIEIYRQTKNLFSAMGRTVKV